MTNDDRKILNLCSEQLLKVFKQFDKIKFECPLTDDEWEDRGCVTDPCSLQVECDTYNLFCELQGLAGKKELKPIPLIETDEEQKIIDHLTEKGYFIQVDPREKKSKKK